MNSDKFKTDARTARNKSIHGFASTDEETINSRVISFKELNPDAAQTHAEQASQKTLSKMVAPSGSSSTGADSIATIESHSDSPVSSSSKLSMDSFREASVPPIPKGANAPMDRIALSLMWSNLNELVSEAFDSARAQVFEDGKESEFAKTIKTLVKARGPEIYNILTSEIFNERIQGEIAAEALKAVADLRDPDTYDIRRQLFEKALFSQSPYVRDAGILGIIMIRDRQSLPWLGKALQREPFDILKGAIIQAIEHLQRE